MNEDTLVYILSRIINNAKDSIEALCLYPEDDFYKGKRLAYYEVLDTVKNELDVREYNLKKYGLELDLEKML